MLTSARGIGLKRFALFMALIAVAAGIYLTFFYSAGYEKTSATIVEVEEEASATVRYTVDGVSYTGVLTSYSPSYKVGKTIEVLYDPKDPSIVHDGGFMGLYVLGVGLAIFAAVIGTELRTRKALKALPEAKGQYPPSVKGTVRQLYFVTDAGTAKVGHHIEDEEGRVLYEARMTKFTLTAPYGFEFIDHEHGTCAPHLIGHEESSEWDSLLIDNQYTFSFDGEDIWKHLKQSGISVDSRLVSGMKMQYRILRDGQEIGTAESGRRELGLPVQGFYRIKTAEQDLSLLFVTLLAFARSGASDDRGGNFKTLLNTIRGK